ncbi:plasmid replication/partition related protein [Xanthomonas sp. NCPPB 2654]|uniref:plasmid replication/partition related protein n=1 Tax=unclassified Xanthomonas TaxID=2643310 RepID=UPI0021E0F196|nr:MULTISPECIES: plasmid replication/partition related protein [unclassified Xanthomonas]MDL5368076.1 plasmid replication/partition related protein [Xanthomonas sp. NCPPB 2654]UYC19214.1 plasmid replication/partition related protein [Xanthomonas sp. CFBP 8443]
MNIVVNEDLKAYIDPLTADEYAALERSLLAEGCRDALVLWGEILVDGHNRYGICQKHGLPFQTVQNTRFQSLQDVHLWMIDQHLGRRSVSDFQRGVLALRKREILAERRSRAAAPTAASADGTEATTDAHDDAAPWADAPSAGETGARSEAVPAPLSRADLARAARLSNSQVVQIEKIQKQATAEVVEAVKSGAISINAAAAVAGLPEEEQRAAARAGKDELKQAAKRARESKRKPRETPAEQDGDGDAVQGDAELAALRLRVAELDAENRALREELAALRAQLQD